MKRWCLLAAFFGISLVSISRAADPPAPHRAAAQSKQAAAPAARPAESSSVAPKVMDRIDLEATQVTGNRELPKVMVIVPWKHADAGAVAGRPANSLMDEVLKPLDREVLRRELDYYAKVGGEPGQSPSKPEN